MKKLAILTVRALMLFAVALLLPAGVVAETIYCTGITAVPTTINSRGIYCFTKNLTSSITGGNAITITTSDVTIDMNGYTLRDVTTNGNTYGIRADNQNNIAIRNGAIRGYRWGITLVGGRGHLVEDLLLDGNRLAGFNLVDTKGTVIRNNRVLQTENAEGTTFAIYLKGVRSCTIINNDIVLDTPQGVNIWGIIASNSSSIIEKNRISLNSESVLPGSTGIAYWSSSKGLLVDNRFGGFLNVGLTCEFGRAKVRDNLVSSEVVTPYFFSTCVDAGNNQ